MRSICRRSLKCPAVGKSKIFKKSNTDRYLMQSQNMCIFAFNFLNILCSKEYILVTRQILQRELTDINQTQNQNNYMWIARIPVLRGTKFPYSHGLYYGYYAMYLNVLYVINTENSP